MVRETWVQSQVASYQRLLKWYLIPPCLTLSNIRCVSRVKWSNPGKGVAPSSTPRCSSLWKGNLRVTLDYGGQIYLLYNRNVICIRISIWRIEYSICIRISIWSDKSFLSIIISYMKPCSSLETNANYWTEIITWNHMISCITLEYLKPYNHGQKI